MQNQCRCQAADAEDDANLATSLKELEAQNDRLQQALEEETKTKDATLTELQTNVGKCIKLINILIY